MNEQMSEQQLNDELNSLIECANPNNGKNEEGKNEEGKNEEGKNKEGKRPISNDAVANAEIDKKQRTVHQRTAQQRTQQRTTHQKTRDQITDAIGKVKGVNTLQQEALLDVFVGDLKMPPRNEQSIESYLISQIPETVTGHETLRQLVQDWLHSCAPLIHRAKKLFLQRQQEILEQMTSLAKMLYEQGYKKDSISQTLMAGPHNDAALVNQVIENL